MLRRGLLLTAALAVCLGGCDILEDGFVVEGQAVDSEGKALEGVTIKAYAFTDNLSHLAFADDEVELLDPTSYKVRVDLPGLSRNGRVAGQVVTGPDGSYTFDGLPVDGVILIASKDTYSNDIAGMNRQDGTVSLQSALKPALFDEEDLSATIRANFKLAGGPAEDGDDGASQDVDPVPDDGGDDGGDLTPPAETTWAAFSIADDAGTVLADASSANATIAASTMQGMPIAIRARHQDASVTDAFLRVRYGSSGCDDGPPPETHLIPVKLSGGVLTSDAGELQRWYLSGGREQYQIDLDNIPDNGNESFVVDVQEPCAPPQSALIITMTWDQDLVDADLYVWDTATGEQTYHGSYYEGSYGASSYGSISVADRLGRGPEVFTLSPGKSGKYIARAHFFCGAPTPETRVTINVRRFAGGEWKDESFSAVLPFNDWLDIGVFPVDPVE